MRSYATIAYYPGLGTSSRNTPIAHFAGPYRCRARDASAMCLCPLQPTPDICGKGREIPSKMHWEIHGKFFQSSDVKNKKRRIDHDSPDVCHAQYHLLAGIALSSAPLTGRSTDFLCSGAATDWRIDEHMTQESICGLAGDSIRWLGGKSN